MLGYTLLQFGVTRGSSTGGAISWGWGSVELIALWSPAVMIALEIMSTVKRVANPSAVRRTRKARMTELKRQKLRGCCAARDASIHRCVRQSAEENLNDR